AAGNKIGAYNPGLSASWMDTTAAFNTQYHYLVIANYLNWTRTAPVESALSLNPTSGTDATGAAAALTATNLTNLSLADNITFTTGSSWATTPTNYTSSNLKGVSFLTTSTGWAVGAAGTILKTVDGGFSWTADTSGTTNNLEG